LQAGGHRFDPDTLHQFCELVPRIDFLGLHAFGVARSTKFQSAGLKQRQINRAAIDREQFTDY
jgi:hypothetical protein